MGCKRLLYRLSLCLICVALGGCAGQGVWLQPPDARARAELASAGFRVLPEQLKPIGILASNIPLLAAVRATDRSDFLTVFIEGDGAAWPRSSIPPADPTPNNPLGLNLAIVHLARGGEAVAYLGRPCQYLSPQALENCPLQWWTTGRFGPEPLALMNEALDQLKAARPGARLRLVGYSGGGAIATLLAAQRGDVACLVTVAAPLDTDAWTRAKHVSTLVDSLNPLNAAIKLRGSLMSHLSGEKDLVVPPGTNQKFFEVTQTQDMQQTGFEHTRPWLQAWPELAQKTCLTRY